jgi:type III restriction enzyme
LAGQLVQHLLIYLSDDEARAVLDRDRRLIAENIHAQMMEHFWEKAAGYEVKVSRGFTQLKPCNYTASATSPMKSYRETVEDKGLIKKLLFGGFEKCLYPLQKFDSDSERRFAVILERSASKWFRPVKGQFQIYYKLGSEQPEYVPDFVA